MNENDMPQMIPYVVHESEVARLERTIKRLFILCVLLILVAVGTNAYWIWYEAQFEDISTTVTQDLDASDGDMYNRLETMMHEASTEREREAIRRAMEQL